jgi:ATP-dependent DNA ligase
VTETVTSRSAIPARLPDFVDPMKAKLVGSMPVGAWIYEIKFDGYRALALRAGGTTLSPPKGVSQQILTR